MRDQTADANLVHLGDLGPSNLYGQYSDYKTLGLDLGYRRYVPLTTSRIRVYGEGTLGIAFIDSINVQPAAPQANSIVDQTDFYDQTSAFTWGSISACCSPLPQKSTSVSRGA